VIGSGVAEPVELGSMPIEAIALNAADIIDRLARPTVLAADGAAYAFTIPGDSMWPRFRQGRRVAVSPGTPIATGDDVAVTIRRDPATGVALVVIGELMDAGKVRLRQFNPDAVFTIDPGHIVAIHKIVGELI
jgi:phage repressor protein C with HTH and peptisase S24 domain